MLPIHQYIRPIDAPQKEYQPSRSGEQPKQDQNPELDPTDHSNLK